MRKIALLPALLFPSFIISSTSLMAIDALSPVERFLGSDYDSDDYSDIDYNKQNPFAPESPADSDLGDQLILKRHDSRNPLRIDLSTQIFWTDNLASTSFNEQDGFIWQTRLLASWKPRVADNLFADVTASQNIYRYDSLSALDFERTDFRAGLVKIAPDFFNILFFTRYEYARVTSGSLSSSIYDAHRVRVGAHKVFLNKPKHTAYAAIDYAYDFSTSPSALERNELGGHLGYTYQINDKVRAVFYYHLSFYDYDQGGREDYNHVLGSEIYWQLSQSTRLNASFTYVKNDSNLPFGGADYNSLQGGLGIGFTKTF